MSQQESRWHSSHLEASRPETWVELMLQFEFEGKEKKKESCSVLKPSDKKNSGT